MIPNNDELAEFFDYNKPFDNPSTASRSLPLENGSLDSQYDVVRLQQTTVKNGVRYQYYSVSVTDSNATDAFNYTYSTDIILLGRINTAQEALTALDKIYYRVLVPTSLGSLVSSITGSTIGSLTFKNLVASFFNYVSDSPENYIITSKDAYKIEDVHVFSEVKYIFVYGNNQWYNVYNVSRAEWILEHEFNRFNGYGNIQTYSRNETLEADGDFFKSYKAVDYYIENCNANGGTYRDTGTIWPYRYYSIPAISIEDINGQKHSIAPRLYMNTTQLMGIL